MPPQPLGTVPQTAPNGHEVSAVHPQWLASALPPPQVSGMMQLLGQVTGFPQLLVAGPQAFPLHVVARLSSVQLQWLLVHC